MMNLNRVRIFFGVLALIFLGGSGKDSIAADKLNFIYTARVMSQSYPYIAQEVGLFKKYDLEVPSSLSPRERRRWRQYFPGTARSLKSAPQV
jgi:hypothetical protein